MMAIEIELKLSLSPATANRLRKHSLLAGQAPLRQRLENTYYDTPQLDLCKKQVAVRRRRKGGQWLLTVKSAESASGGLARRSEWERPAAPDDFNFSMVDNKKLRRCLEAQEAALTPIFTTHFTRCAWQLEYAGARIELALDRGKIESGSRQMPICEVEIELIDGELGALFALAQALQNDLPLHPSTESKAERGYALFQNAPRRPCRANPGALDGDTNAVVAFRHMALNCLDQLQRNEAGTCCGDDPEFLHQARIALRRLRACLNLFAKTLPPEFVQRYQQGWRDFANSLNEARDWDVFLSKVLPPLNLAFLDDAALARLNTAAEEQSRQAHQQVAKKFTAADYSHLLLEFTAALFALSENGAPSLAKLSRRRLQQRTHQARHLAHQPHELNAEDLHQLRIRCKQLRYTLEFTTLKKRDKAYLNALIELQEELGLINDHTAALHLLTRLSPTNRPTLVHGWLAGRHALLIEKLPAIIDLWLAQRPSWKYS